MERKVQAKGKGKGSAASARPASKGKGKDSTVPARQFVTPRAKGYEGDDSEEEPPAKPLSSRPSKSVRSDDLIGLTWCSCSVLPELGFPEVGGD